MPDVMCGYDRVVLTTEDRGELLRRILVVLLVLLPSKPRMLLARKAFGWDIHPSAHIGRSLLLVGHLSMGPNSSIGSFNMFRGLEEVRLAEGASIASRNWIAAPAYAPQVLTASTRRAVLIMGEYAMITVGHEIDCSDRVEFGPHARIAGFKTQILTHSLNLMTDRWITGPVELGERCVVMSSCMLLNGSRVPDRSVVSAGSVVATKLTKEQTFYRGNPAVAVRRLPDNLAYFRTMRPGSGA
jgi:acetyltransferase-like isoleucine patch superfamily enzyme